MSPWARFVAGILVGRDSHMVTVAGAVAAAATWLSTRFASLLERIGAAGVILTGWPTMARAHNSLTATEAEAQYSMQQLLNNTNVLKSVCYVFI